MAKVTVHSNAPSETPSQSIVRAANHTTAVTDANNRVIGIKKLSALDRLKLFEVLGPENSKNEQYAGYAALAFMVASIDGESVPRPTTKIQLEALVQRLDDAGMDAIAGHIATQIAAQPDENPDALKNGSSTPS